MSYSLTIWLFFKELVALAYDTVQVIKQALNREPCSSMNASVVTSRERDAMLKCMRKVSKQRYFFLVRWIRNNVQGIVVIVPNSIFKL